MESENLEDANPERKKQPENGDDGSARTKRNLFSSCLRMLFRNDAVDGKDQAQ